MKRTATAIVTAMAMVVIFLSAAPSAHAQFPSMRIPSYYKPYIPFIFKVRPDLKITDFILDQGLCSSREFYLRLYVKATNSGGDYGAATGTPVLVNYTTRAVPGENPGGWFAGHATIGMPAPGASVWVRLEGMWLPTFYKAWLRDVYFNCRVDPANTIAESNESNNTKNLYHSAFSYTCP